MRQRADLIHVRRDFVLVSESYSPGALGFFGSVPHLERVYHAPWPGVCDALRTLGGHLGRPTGLAPVPRDYADHQMCNCGAQLGSGWRGWLRNYRHYEVRLTAGIRDSPGTRCGRGPGVTSCSFRPRGPVIDEKIVIPEGRARRRRADRPSRAVSGFPGMSA